MKAIAAWIAACVALLVVLGAGVSLLMSRPLFDETLDSAVLDDITIAPVNQALTFARIVVDNRPRVLLVRQYRGGRVTAIDLSQRLKTHETDPVKLFRQLGYAALENEAASIANLVGVDASALDVPFETREQNIGIGLNYAEHARESSLDEQPFVFPKIARPTGHLSNVAKGDAGRLDYEAEVGFVALNDITTLEPTPTTMGLVLTNDITDRWALVRNFERGAEMGTTGFVDGKSRAGFAPVGNLLVIPRNLEQFHKSIELRLYLNGRLRQHESAAAMIWGPQQMLDGIFSRAHQRFHSRTGPVPLLGATRAVTAGTIIFSGTPSGVIFRPFNVWNPWLYLQPDDEVVIRADYLGVIRNHITD